MQGCYTTLGATNPTSNIFQAIISYYFPETLLLTRGENKNISPEKTIWRTGFCWKLDIFIYKPQNQTLWVSAGFTEVLLRNYIFSKNYGLSYSEGSNAYHIIHFFVSNLLGYGWAFWWFLGYTVILISLHFLLFKCQRLSLSVELLVIGGGIQRIKPSPKKYKMTILWRRSIDDETWSVYTKMVNNLVIILLFLWKWRFCGDGPLMVKHGVFTQKWSII